MYACMYVYISLYIYIEINNTPLALYASYLLLPKTFLWVTKDNKIIIMSLALWFIKSKTYQNRPRIPQEFLGERLSQFEITSLSLSLL